MIRVLYVVQMEIENNITFILNIVEGYDKMRRHVCSVIKGTEDFLFNNFRRA